MRRILLFCAASVLLLLSNRSAVTAAVLFESGTLGLTGVSWAELNDQTVAGTNVKHSVFPGVRFELNKPVVTSHIGGHFAAPQSGTFFGALIELSGENDFPNSIDLSTSDLLGHALLTFPTSSAEVFGDLSLSLDPGWYALVFGSGLFGATANGGAVRNGSDIDEPSYISFGPNFGWSNITTFPNHRFVVQGIVVPEPATPLLMAFIFSVLFTRKISIA